MPVYHVACLDVERLVVHGGAAAMALRAACSGIENTRLHTRPVVHKGRYIPGVHEYSLYGYTEGSSEAGFSDGPVLDIWGRCIGTFKGKVGDDDLSTKLFVKNSGLAAFWTICAMPAMGPFSNNSE